MRAHQNHFTGLIGCCLLLWLAALAAPAADSFAWNKEKNLVSADVRGVELPVLLERVASDAGWQVFVEPGTEHKASAKFKDLASGEALRMLLGDLNFALIPQTNGNPRLYVFRTDLNNATQQISPVPARIARAKPVRVPNELIVRLKPGENIDELARALGAKVVGRIPELNAYRLQFEDAAATADAFASLNSNPSVASVDYNYYLDRPEPAQSVVSSSGLPAQLQLKPSDGSGGVIVGLVDTAVQTLGNELDKFITKRISIAGETAADNTSPLHGTTMFESILQGIQSTGVADASSKFISVDVFGNNGNTTTFNVAAGIVAAANNGANWINVSLGGSGGSAVLKDIVQTLADRGIAVFAAAGNEPTGEPVYPAAYPGVVAVTALNRGQLAPYANMAPFVDLAAPGSGIVYYYNRPYLVQGTSVSTAFTTGAAVGLAEKNGATWSQVEPTLFKTLAVPSATTK